MRTTRRLTLVLCLAMLAGACTVESTQPAGASVVEQMLEARAMGDYAQPWYFGDPTHASPLTSFVIDGVRYGPISDLLVVGTITAVEPGQGYAWPTGPQVEGQEDPRVVLGFDDPEGELVSIHLVVEVTHLLAPDGAVEADKVRVGISLAPRQDLAALKAELEGRRIAVPLMEGARTAFDLEEDVFGIVGDGSLLGFVDDNDLVTFGVFETAQWPGGVDAPVVPVARLLAPPKEVRLSMVEGVLVAADH